MEAGLTGVAKSCQPGLVDFAEPWLVGLVAVMAPSEAGLEGLIEAYQVG